MKGGPLDRKLEGPARVLVVTSRVGLAGEVRVALNHGAFHTQVAENSSDAASILHSWRPNLAVVEMELDGGRVMDMLTEDPSREGHVPVIAVTDRGDHAATLEAFARGVDDILVTPFDPAELIVRTIAVIRRAYSADVPLVPTIRIGEIEADLRNRSVRVGDLLVHLSHTQARLLYFMLGNVGRRLTQEEILLEVWGQDAPPDSNVVARHIRELRQLLQNSHTHPRFIQTIPGGYRFIPESG